MSILDWIRNIMLGFRVWDVENKHFVDLKENLEASDYPFSINYLGNSDFEDEWYIYNQSTGLTDCNGKMIYEGDIIETITHMVINCEVFIVDTVHRFFDKYYYRRPGTELDSFYFKVIGNIYENVDLAEKLK